MATTYAYSPLVPQRPEIRLITLHSGQFQDDVIISIHHHEFTETYKPSYEALSYVWGSVEDQETVAIHDSKDSEEFGVLKSLHVTKNLRCALRHLRLSDEARILWVDALCIDQGNLGERSVEVGRMGEIYASADIVLIWLGPATSDSDLAIQMIKSLSADIHFVGSHNFETVPGGPADSYRLDPHTSISTEPLKWEAIKSFFGNPWFSRLWVRQEVRLASRHLAILGHSKLVWEDLEKTVRLLLSVSDTISTYLDFDDMQRIRSLFYRTPESLVNILSVSSNTKYQDPRDIIYANLSMSSEIRSLHIQPDYEKSQGAVYQDVFFKDFQKHGVLDLMSFCDIRYKLPGIPSFIPDFSTPKSYNYNAYGFAGGMSMQMRNCKEASRLSLKGVSITVVTEVKSRAPLDSNMSDIIMISRDWEPESLESAPYCCGGSLLDAYSSTLIGSRGRNARRCSSIAEECGKEFLHSVWSGRDSKRSEDLEVSWYLQNLGRTLQGRAFFETSDRHIGLSPADVRTGDRICVLLGGVAPFILRPLPENPAMNQVVGPCYLHGVMFGEAILGAIPELWVCSEDTKSGDWQMQFTNRETGKRTFMDPRVQPFKLQSEWEIHYCEDDGDLCGGDCVEEDKENNIVLGWFFNKLTKEETWYDPRLSADSLMQRGVKIEDIILV